MPTSTKPVFPSAVTRGAKLALCVVLTFNLAMLVFYVVSGYRSDFHGDAAVKNLLAQEMFETGQFFPAEWSYVNGDLLVLFGQLFILPLLPFMPNGYPAHAFAGLVSSALILVSTWFVMGMLTPSSWSRIAGLALVASGLSYVSADSLFGQVSYGGVYSFAAFSLFFAWRATDAGAPRARLAWIALFGVLTIAIYWSNPQRAIAYYGLPMACALAVALEAAWRQARLDDRPLRGLIGTGAAMVVAAAVGTALHAIVLRGLNNMPGAGAARWLGFDGMVDNAAYTLHGLLAVLGAVPPAGGTVTSVAGAFAALRLAAALAALVLIGAAVIWSLSRRHATGIRMFGAFTAGSLLLVLFLQVATTIPDMRDPVVSARYLIPAVVFGLLLSIAMAAAADVDRRVRGCAWIVLAVLALAALSPGNPLSRGWLGRVADERNDWIRALHGERLSYGYATYWNAGATTVLSDGSVRVRQIVIRNGIPVPMRHMSSNRWYRADAAHGPSFLMLDDTETASVDWPTMTAYLGPHRTTRIGKMNVHVFQRNIASALPGWDRYITRPVTLLPTPESPHVVGEFDVGRRRLVAKAGSNGALHYGPYMAIGAGRYVAIFDLETAGEGGGDFGHVDIVADAGQFELGSAKIKAVGPARVVVPFSPRTQVEDLELRVFSNGRGELALRSITLAPAGP